MLQNQLKGAEVSICNIYKTFVQHEQYKYINILHIYLIYIIHIYIYIYISYVLYIYIYI